MTFYFENYSRYVTCLYFDDDKTVFLQPFQNVSVERKDCKDLKLILKQNKESYRENHAIRYHLLVESEYHITDVCDGETFKITREKIQFDLGVLYERLFLLVTNASIYHEHHRIAGEEKIKKIYKKSRKLNMFLFGPLEDSTGLVVLLIIIGIVLSGFLGWKLAVIYFPCYCY